MSDERVIDGETDVHIWKMEMWSTWPLYRVGCSGERRALDVGVGATRGHRTSSVADIIHQKRETLGVALRLLGYWINSQEDEQEQRRRENGTLKENVYVLYYYYLVRYASTNPTTTRFDPDERT